MEITEEQIRNRAYEIWEREGQPHGRNLEHWLQAHWELMNEVAAKNGSGDSGKAASASDKPKTVRRTTKAKAAPAADAAAAPAKTATAKPKSTAKTTAKPRSTTTKKT